VGRCECPRPNKSLAETGSQPNKSLAQNGSTESLASIGPPLGDLSQCSATIVEKVATPEPDAALALVVRTWSASREEWSVINQVRNDVKAEFDSGDKHRFAKAFLLVRQVASPAKPDSEVGLALRPLEISLAEAVGKTAHKMSVVKHWLNKDGPRAEFLRGCQEQFEAIMTPRLRSRMLLTYHKLYGSKEEKDSALFSSKAFNRNAHTRKRKEKKEVVQEKREPVSVVRSGGRDPVSVVRSGGRRSGGRGGAPQQFWCYTDGAMPCAMPWCYAWGTGQPWCYAYGTAGQPWYQ
jgi:hypothetical protein